MQLIVARVAWTPQNRRMDLVWWQWALAIAGAFFVGLSKTGIAGLGVLTVAIFANIMPARQSAGVVLPLLIFADVIAVRFYLRDASWPHLLRLFPWAVAGIIAGFVAMDYIDDQQTARLIGAILVILIAVQVWRSRKRLFRRKETAPAENGDVPHRTWFAAVMGIMAGFTTMVANAAGPIMTL